MSLRNIDNLLQRIAGAQASSSDIKRYHELKRKNDALLNVAWPPYKRAAEKALKNNRIYPFGID